MELQFQERPFRCLRHSAADTRSCEQTLEVRIPDDMPAIGRVLGAWGQVLVRGKEWRGEHAAVNGGVMARVLYQAEEDDSVCSVEGWIPFQLRWELQDSQQDGTVVASCLLRSLDARQTGAGKLMLRASVSAMAQALEPHSYTLYSPGDVPEDVQLLEESFPICVPVEAGEKEVELEEDILLPPGKPDVQKILFYRLTPTVREKKIMGDKLVFRGSAQLHVVYLGTDGRVHVFDTELPMSQYAQLDSEYGPEAELWVEPVVTDLELEREEDGRLRLKADILGQYVICDRPTVSLVRDAYSTRRALQLHTQQISLPAILEQRVEQVNAQQTIGQQAQQVLEQTVFAAHPRLRAMEQEASLETEGTAQVLYYDEQGQLQCAASPFSQELTLPAAQPQQLLASLSATMTGEAAISVEEITLQADMELRLCAMEKEGIRAVSGLTLEEAAPAEGQKPSLILRRAGEMSLWELAKRCGSTVGAIQTANALAGEPEHDRMLLIPVV